MHGGNLKLHINVLFKKSMKLEVRRYFCRMLDNNMAEL